MNHHVCWRRGALASAIALLVSLASVDAYALALGSITVQSALGEPLRAEIDIAEITADEAGSLRVGVASAEAFRTAGLDYTAAVIGLQVTLQKRLDGRSFLRLSSTRTVIEPFVDLVLDASWSSGRVVRDYTMLFDPPGLRQAAPVVPKAPILSRPVVPSGTSVDAIPYSPAPSADATPLPPRQQQAARAPIKQAARLPAGSSQRVAVKPGDTAGRIAAQNKLAGISLDQMLAALLRSNPDAFIGGNVNRLKSGAVLDIPGADQARSISPAEASRTIVVQSRDFNDFRRKLAEGVPAAQVANTNREAGGKVQAKVEDRATITAAPDKLTLSKGAVQSKAAAEDKIARDRQAKEASDRVAELTKNIGDLNKITGSATAANAAGTPGIAIPIPAPAAMPAPVVAASAPVSAASASKAAASAAAVLAAAPTSSPSVAGSPTASAPVSPTVGTASAPAATVVKKLAVVAPPQQAGPGLMAQLTENTLLLAGLAALILLLIALGFYRLRRKRINALQVDSSFLESRLQPDSFFGGSGGHRIDTNEGGGTGSSLVYSPSQLDATGDVDPVAEADVYLAYGRDLQAEEILKEAMRTNPTRVAIQAKLLEIYAKRRDAKAFEVGAAEAFSLTKGDGPDWAYISKMGRELDSTNPMYELGGQPNSSSAPANDKFKVATASFALSTLPQLPELAAGSTEFAPGSDLDLDFSLAERLEIAALPVVIAPSYPSLTPEFKPEPKDPIFDAQAMNFSVETAALKPTSTSAVTASGLDFTAEPVQATATPVAAQVMADNGMLKFDLASLSLELGSPVTESPTLATTVNAKIPVDPLETKFSLAEEFRALGDSEGARSLAEEVVVHASGALKIRAQAFINSLS